MLTMILISSGALLVGIIGSITIWGMDAVRANEIEETPAPVEPEALPPAATESPKAIHRS